MSPHRTASRSSFARALRALWLPAATALLATAALPAAPAAAADPAAPAIGGTRAAPTASPARRRPELDAAAPAADAPRRPFRPSAAERAKIRAGTDIHADDATGLPTFLWAAPDDVSARARAFAGLTHEQAARRHLAAYASIYDLADDEVANAVLHRVHDTGSGVIIVSFRQEIGGVPVLRDEIRFAMDRDHNLVAISGNLRGRAHLKEHGAPQQTAPPQGAARHFALDAADAIALAYGDLTGAPMDARDLEATGREEGGYAWYDLAAQAQGQYAAPFAGDPRARRVFFPLADRLEPAYHVEVRVAIPGSVEADSYAYVVSAVDGSILLRHGLTASDVFSYRVWAETSTPFRPHDNPSGTVGTPEPSGVIDGYQAPFTAPSLLSLQNGAISTNDPWLPPGATVTTGNNAEAYADLVAPDGFQPGDLRATTTSANSFDRVYDTSQSPVVTTNQQMAAITQLFYDVNFLHDWYYDLGFNEAAGNGQTSNYGRGGIAGDSLMAEAQDGSGRNNANMSTPSDGGRPVMQMYIWDGIGPRALTVNAPASIAGQYATGNALFGPTAYNVTAGVVLVNDGAAPTTDACTTPFTNGAAMVGKIAFIDRGNCTFAVKVKNAQLNGAVGAIIANNADTGLVNMSGTDATITIPGMFITLGDGNTLRAQSGAGLNVTLFEGAAIDRDGDVDNLIVAHEWGHYISNRLIGDALGLDNNQGGSMGEGWGDFDAMLLAVRAEDNLVPSNANWNGTYALAGYAVGGGANGPEPNTSYYFGLRRVPYSTDFTKDPLTFQHIQNGVALPTTAPIQFGQDGSNNAEVHNSGEVWATMLWECYAALLRDSGRLTFAQAQTRMRSYYVAAFKLTPPEPTYTEARDAMLAAAFANDPADYTLFWQAFARRGIGLGAVPPDRYSTTHAGVVESYVAGGGLQVTGAALTDAIRWCDHDGFLDDAETGRLDVTVKNVGIGTLAATTATITTSTPGLSFTAGNVISFPALSPYQTATVGLGVKLTGAVGQQPIDVTVTASDPALATAAVVTTPAFYGNTDVIPALRATDDVESAHTLWTTSGSSAQDPNSAWQRITITGRDHRWLGPDARATADQSLVSPPLHVATGSPLAFTFRHRYSFEFNGTTYFDGGVIEISTNGGTSWLDIGGAASPGYSGTLATGGTNPLQGRLAFVSTSPSYPAFTTVSVSMPGPFAGPVLLRFRIGSDGGVPAPGWEIDDLAFTTLTDTPFDGLVGDRAICLDSDHDGTNDLLDCAPLDATTWAPPTEATGLTLTGASGASLAWGAPASPGGTATLYDVLRSTSASNLAGAVCQTTGTSSLAASDATLPGGTLFYLVRSRNVCGSSLGTNSSGTPRSAPVCP